MSESFEELRKKIISARLNGVKNVNSINEAKQFLDTVTAPIIIQFYSLSLGAEDRNEITELSNTAKERGIYIFYDEADMLQTKCERAKSTAAIFQNCAKRN